jgi:hypothetical protein
MSQANIEHKSNNYNANNNHNLVSNIKHEI